jgi:ribonucleotide monophosphatase NagD (HAD superfamily)
MKSAVDWISDELPSDSTPQKSVLICNETCSAHDAFYQRISEIALRNAAFEEEILSHLSAIQEVNRREAKIVAVQSDKILDRLEKIENQLLHVTNGGLKEAMFELVPIILKNMGTKDAENTRGRWAATVAAISGTFAVLGGLATWIITKFL